jgi:two-component system sensor histidine kinase HupT/HoxJ
MGVNRNPRMADVAAAFSDDAWVDVLQAVDRTYAELVAYQEELEARNAELDTLRRFMESVLESVSDALIVLGRDGRIEQVNAAFRSLAGPGEAWAGRSMAEIVTAESLPAVEAALAEVRKGRSRGSVSAELVTPTGSAPLEITIAPRLDERGRSLGVVLTGRPVGELRRAYSDLEESHQALKEAQAHLVRNEKLASLGRLLAGVAHELNNPISFVYANAHALEKYASRFETYFERVQAGASRDELIDLRSELKLDRELKNLRGAIDGARDGAERVRAIVEDLRRLSADGSGEFTDFDLAETARVASNWVVRGTKTPVRVTFSASGPVMARGRPGHIQQVVMNLVQNALDAVAERSEPAVSIRCGSEGGHAWIEVADNGPGVPRELAAAVFDPFFTTKPVGKGTGLGLSISHKIAEEHGGRLRLIERECGACFRLDIPAAGGTA